MTLTTQYDKYYGKSNSKIVVGEPEKETLEYAWKAQENCLAVVMHPSKVIRASKTMIME